MSTVPDTRDLVGLIRIASAGTFTAAEYAEIPREKSELPWWKRWKVQFRSVLVRQASWEFKLGEQLGAIAALGETGSQEALAFLEDLIFCVVDESYQGGNRDDPYVFADYYSHTYLFPNAKGELSDALSYSYNAE